MVANGSGDTYHGLRVYPLRDVLSRVPLPSHCPLSGVSHKWRCVIVPKILEPTSQDAAEHEVMRFLDNSIPCRLGRWRSAPVYDIVGKDGMKFVTDPRWNRFPKPKIAFKTGWAGPGTHMESPAYHQLVSSFADVFDHKEEGSPCRSCDSELEVDGNEVEEALDDVAPANTLNLQLFHRQDASICPPIPVLGEKLIWPSFLEDGAICDNATRLAQRGAVTWWHLDDSGEFVEQTALPLLPSEQTVTSPPLSGLPHTQRAYFKGIERELLCAEETPGCVPVKLFLYGPKESYDWFMHDDESATSGKVAALDIFSTPDEALPKDATLLPIIHVAVLESGGRPLISPPNIPHLVISLNDCIMVEQRRVAYLFLDEISYFLQKCAFWSGNPIIYDHIENDLQDEAYVAGQLIPSMISLFQEYDAFHPYDEIVRRRVVISLHTIATHEKHYKLSPDSRDSLASLLHGGNAEMSAILQQETPYGLRVVSLEDRLKSFWDVRQYWPKPGCVLKAPLVTPPHLLSKHLVAKGHEVDWFVPVVYTASSPVFGSEKNAVEEVATEYFSMANLAGRRRDLLAFLRTHGKEKDELLDELF
ncbi:hypothetical protein TraAM80_04920 [Trypanosoma rangeli]|uniref:Uncharacterized protein n=1 Tax=Trypanosoma rangeli TaxID=5698 RepID=A0A422NH67_TRYRA|nr:uncharacterized protein TraAM80_04920 [Trypanosoma rangeli]RNF04794.1 hypothetical protein TraAM80_04920 [Trypanosoma rangeli]|eukprot:RNF04794.1 hypothetical protein TraAM80_04920 [Trypanosoma rangeli]